MASRSSTSSALRRGGRLAYGCGRNPSPRPRRARNPARDTWTRERIVTALKDWERTVGAPPRSYDWNPPLARALGYDCERAHRWDAEHPRWPHAHTVVHHFGSWSAGLVAADMPATVREFDLPVGERVAVARRMAAEGIAQARIADYLGVSARAVRNYLRAGDCESCATRSPRRTPGTAAAAPPAFSRRRSGPLRGSSPRCASGNARPVCSRP